MLSLLPLWLAVLIDRCLAEPRNALHPVAWMGSLIERGARPFMGTGWWVSLAGGCGIVVVGGVGAICLSGLVQSGFDALPPPASWFAEAIVLKTMFSMRALKDAAGRVASQLLANDIPAARQTVGCHLVSRDTSKMGESQLAAATVESLFENTNDSVVAPLLYYLLAGLPGVVFFRFVNTCDAMLGYREEPYHWLGKASARLDDVLNFIPARLTAALVLMAGFLLKCDVADAVGVWLRDCRRTASPNSGHPMSAAAGVLRIQLEKSGQYQLGRGQRPPSAADIAQGVTLFDVTAAMTLLAISVSLVVREQL